MKYKARFVIPTVAANKIGIDIASTYLVDVVTYEKSFIYVTILDQRLKNASFLLEENSHTFKEYMLVISGWMNHNYWTQDSYLFKGALELLPSND